MVFKPFLAVNLCEQPHEWLSFNNKKPLDFCEGLFLAGLMIANENDDHIWKHLNRISARELHTFSVSRFVWTPDRYAALFPADLITFTDALRRARTSAWSPCVFSLPTKKYNEIIRLSIERSVFRRPPSFLFLNGFLSVIMKALRSPPDTTGETRTTAGTAAMFYELWWFGAPRSAFSDRSRYHNSVWLDRAFPNIALYVNKETLWALILDSRHICERKNLKHLGSVSNWA